MGTQTYPCYKVTTRDMPDEDLEALVSITVVEALGMHCRSKHLIALATKQDMDLATRKDNWQCLVGVDSCFISHAKGHMILFVWKQDVDAEEVRILIWRSY